MAQNMAIERFEKKRHIHVPKNNKTYIKKNRARNAKTCLIKWEQNEKQYTFTFDGMCSLSLFADKGEELTCLSLIYIANDSPRGP